MCQWGAAEMARAGKGYREILAHYYPGTEVVKMY
jgi:stage II sporulation protein D